MDEMSVGRCHSKPTCAFNEGPSQGNAIIGNKSGDWICEDIRFFTRNKCVNHLIEQHSGVSFKCTLCKKLFIRNDNLHTCKAKKEDFDRFAQVHVSGKLGPDAEKELSDFIATVVNKNVNDMHKVVASPSKQKRNSSSTPSKRQCRLPPIHITAKTLSSIPSNPENSRNRTKSDRNRDRTKRQKTGRKRTGEA